MIIIRSTAHHCQLLLFLTIHTLSIILFISGFFPEVLRKNATEPERKQTDDLGSIVRASNSVCSELNSSNSAKLILVVIDAWRAEFLTRRGEDMPFLNDLLNERTAINCVTSVQLPTVTLPRIKALTSGTQSSFLDAVYNFAASDSTEDNWLDIINQNNESRILFYGDDTWLKLYQQDQFLARSEGTTSFFVSDFYEVDNNVTENVRREFASGASDWDVLIMHYLGLDHIGHSLGAGSALIGHKLAEMDRVLRELYHNCTALYSVCHLLVTGDHGMTDAGTHGGASVNERLVSTVFIPYPSKVDQSASSAAEQCAISQVDLAASISALRGVRTPSGSLGVIATPIVRLVKGSREMACLLKANLRQMMSLLNFDGYPELLKDCTRLLSESTDSRSDSEMDIFSARITAVCKLIQQQLMNVSSSHNDTLIYIAIVLNLFLPIYLVVSKYSTLKGSSSQSKSPVIESRSNEFLLYSLVVGLFGVALSRFSSSFVEEEHMLWHYVVVTWFLLALCFQFAPGTTPQRNYKYSPNVKHCAVLIAILITLRLAQGFIQGGVKWVHLESTGTQLLRNADICNLLVCVSAAYVLLVSIYDNTKANEPSLCSISVIALQTFTTIVLLLYRYYNADLDALATGLGETSGHDKLGLLTAARVLYCCVLCLILTRQFKLAMLTIVLLLCRAEHCALMVFIDSLARLTAHLSISANRLNNSARILLFYALMNAAFFYTGNSMHFGSIDVSRGYIGVSQYSAVVCASLIVVHGYAGPLMLACHAISSYDGCRRQLVGTLLTVRTVTMAVYMIVLYSQRYHLFVWSVFAPKLFYEIAHSILFLVIVVMCVFYDCLAYLGMCFMGKLGIKSGGRSDMGTKLE